MALQPKNQKLQASPPNLPAVITAVDLAIQKMDMVATMEAIKESGDMQLSPLSLERITVPGDNTYAWTIPGEDRPRSVEYLDGLIVHHHAYRQYYDTPYDPQNPEPRPPLCVSFNGRTGQGNPGGLCERCPHYPIGELCYPFAYIYLLLPDETLPKLVAIPRTSLTKQRSNGLTGARQYLTVTPFKSGKPLFAHLTRLGLTKRDHGLGMCVTFQQWTSLEPQAVEFVRQYARAFRESLSYPAVSSGQAYADPTAVPAQVAPVGTQSGLYPGDDDDIPDVTR